MSVAAFILGDSGTGKTASLRNLDPKTTLLIQSLRKPLSFRAKGWAPYNHEKQTGNILVTDSSEKIVRTIKATTHPRVVINDWQYILANEFMRRSDERGFDKFTDIGRHAWDVVRAAANAAPNRRVYILAHTQTDDTGHTKIKTIGKLLDEKITVEGMVTICLRTHVMDGNYYFSTRNSGQDTVKSPMGMFEHQHIENDLAAVDKAICDYYGIDDTTTETPEAVAA